MSIRRKILTRQLAVVIAVCLITSLAALHLVTASLKACQLSKLQVIAHDKAEQIASLLEAKRHMLERIAMGRDIAEYAKTYNDPALIQYFNKFREEFSSLAYAGEDGQVELKLVDGKLADYTPNLADTELFQAALWERNRVHMALNKAEDAADLAMRFAICRYNYFDECEGVIVGEVPLAEIFADLRATRIGETGFLVVLAEDDTLLSHPNPAKVLGKVSPTRYEDYAAALHAPEADPSGTGRVLLAGTDGFAACGHVADRNWTVVALLPYREFMAAPRTLGNTCLLVSGVLLVVCGVASVAMSSTITTGLSKLAAVTRALAGGDLSQRAAITSHDEIGALGKAFNHMAERLQGSIEKLHTEIEERKKAQDELTAANDRLRQTQSDLVQSEKMSMLGELAAGVAHEINTPIGAILNVSIDTMEHLRALIQLETELSTLPAETRQWLEDVVSKGWDVVPGESSLHLQRRKAQRTLRDAGVPEARRLAEAMAAHGLVDQADDPAVRQHLSHARAVEFLEHVAALKTAAQISSSSAKKIIRIVRALSFYSRDSRGTLTDIRVNESIDDALVLLRNRLKHHTEVKLSFQDDLPDVRSGPELAQVWTNLLTNACDAIEASRDKDDPLGTIEITTAAVGDNVVVTFANNGPPIGEDALPRIFDPFFTTKPLGKGTGLGLSVCAGVVRRCGGTITARNERGRVVFEVVLPAAGSARAAKLEETTSTPRPVSTRLG